MCCRVIDKNRVFRISATYEIRTTKYNGILYFNDDEHLGEMSFYIKRKEDKQTERQKERECVSASVGQCRE